MSDDKTFEQREEERIARALQKKSGPQTMDELRKKKELDHKRKLEQDKKKQEQEEAKKKEAELQRQKLEKLKLQKEAEEKAAKEREREQELERQKERDLQAKREQEQSQQKKAQNDDDDEDAAEAARMSKMFGIKPAKAAPEHKTGVDALLQKDRQQVNATRNIDEPKPVVTQDWRDQHEPEHPPTTIKNFADEDEDLEAKEAARMAKMFGLSPQRLTTESPKNQKTKASGPSPITVNEDDAAAAKEAERMARMMGGNPKKYDPKEDEREKDRKKFEQSLQGISDPKELSKAFLNDPGMMAHLKDVKGVIAVNTLKGVDIPGGHKF